MEKFLRDNFDVDAKRPSDEALRRWRSSVSVVKNPRRRFRMVADLAKRAEADRKRKKLQEKIRVALYVQKAALQFIDAAALSATNNQNRVEYKLPDEVKQAGFGIEPNDLATMVRSHDKKALTSNGGVEGLSRLVSVSLTNGIVSSDVPVRQEIYGTNQYAEKPSRSFWMFVWEALHDLTLIILMVCAVVSVGVGIATEGWPDGMYDGIGIILCIFLVVMVTATSDYKQSLQFKVLDKEKKNVMVQVTREGCRQKVSVFDLVVGDIVHLSIGDLVPADGVLVSGHSLSVDESSLSGESEPVDVSKNRPFLLSGTKVQDGSGKMLVTAVGMRTEWGRLMVTLSEAGDEETPLQVKLNGVATIIGKIGLVFAMMTFLVLLGRYLLFKADHNQLTEWSMNDALQLLNFFAIAVTIIVVAVPEGLPLAVTLSLAFAMKKLMNDKALVRHLSACETMGSSSCICTDKTGTLTTNHMVVNKVWICGETKPVSNKAADDIKKVVSGSVFEMLLQAIFQNTGSEVVKGKDGKTNILGTPTDTAILEFGILLGGDFKVNRRESEIVKIEPFNSVKKKMSALVTLPDRKGFRAFCKGASEIILKVCDKVIGSDGKEVSLTDQERRKITSVIDQFASEALRTLCLAYKDLGKAISKGNNIPEEGYTLIAIVGIKDPVRPGVKEAVRTCLAAGIKVRMVTGDNINTAKAIARECGILTDDGLAIEGSDFRDKTPEELEEIIPRLQVFLQTYIILTRFVNK
ncbi:Calcium-transporting ATPase 4, plasma membrane-type [Linum grandiflorum]